MKITKEIAYRYLKDKGTMNKYCDNFSVVDIFTEPSSIGVNEHPVIRCEYKEDGSSFRTGCKNVHIDLSKFGDWIKTNRENILDELLK
jgi:hypothetical protein